MTHKDQKPRPDGLGFCLAWMEEYAVIGCVYERGCLWLILPELLFAAQPVIINLENSLFYAIIGAIFRVYW
jgi:hypothetical protein